MANHIVKKRGDSYNRNRKERDLYEEHSDQRYHEGRKRADHKGVTRLWWWL